MLSAVSLGLPLLSVVLSDGGFGLPSLLNGSFSFLTFERRCIHFEHDSSSSHVISPLDQIVKVLI